MAETTPAATPGQQAAGPFRGWALGILALLYAVTLANFGGVTAEGRASFELLTILACALALGAAYREGRLYLPNFRTIAASTACCIAAWIPVHFSIWHEASFRALLLGVHYLLLYLVLVLTLQDKRILRTATFLLLCAGAALSIWGAARQVGAGESWGGGFPGWAHAGSFVNRNHFASFLGMLIPLALYSGMGLRSRAASGGPLTGRSFPYLILCVVLFLSFLLTLSLGGLLAMTLALLAMLADLFTSPGTERKRRLLISVGLLLTVLVLFLLWFGGGPLAARITQASTGEEASSLERIAFWKTALAIWLDHPLVGTGWGSFPHAFANYRPAGVPYRVQFAHNEWLQVLSEAGLIGVTFLVALMVAFVSYSFHPSRPIRDHYYRHLARGASLGLLFVGAHALFDFPLHIPANSAITVALAAFLTTAASHRENARPPAVTLPEHKGLRLPLLAAALALLAILGWQDLRVLFSERAEALSEAQLEVGDAALASAAAEKALWWRPGSAGAEHLLARALLRRAAKSALATERMRQIEQAHEALGRATEKAPRWPRYWTDRADTAVRLGRRKEAEQYYLRGIELGPNDPYPLLERGLYEWKEGHFGLGALDLRRALEIDDRFIGRVTDTFQATTGMQPGNVATLAAIMETAMPDTREGHVALANLFREANLITRYREQLVRAFYRDPDDPLLLEKVFLALTEGKQYEEAREALSHYTSRHPEDPRALFLFGKSQAKTDRWADAIEAYRSSLALVPDQPEVYKAQEEAQRVLGKDEGHLFWQRLTQRFPNNPAYNFELGRRYAEMGRWIEAVQELKVAIGKDPENIAYRNTLANYYVRRRLFAEAISQWEEVARLSPQNTAPLFQIARTYRKLKLPDLARPYYERILKIDPSNQEARTFLTEHAG